MRFGKTLRQSIHPPWKDKYIDYAKLKSILRDDRQDDEDEPWTEEDERKFGDELLNNQLEKVASFHEETFKAIRDRVDAAFDTLKDLGPNEGKGKARGDMTTERLRQLEGELDQITNDVKELKAYSALNYTGFLKIVKKHDRKRGERYRVRPMMQARLAQRPFNSEQWYTPLLRKLSLMYFAIRQDLEGEGAGGAVEPVPIIDMENQPETHNGETYTAYKFWVHLDNLLEVKTHILRRLPSLVYSQSSAKEVDGSEDPRLSSLYLDNSKFDLYLKKVEQQEEAASLRVRWYGQLSSKPDIYLEQKIVHASGSSEERKFTIKEKYIKAFLDGDYRMEKSMQKMERQGRSVEEVEAFRSMVETIGDFIGKNKLQPLVRANYVRTAFQKPADDRVRISIDTELVFVREDVLDKRHPCRHPDDWHRRDMDNRSLAYPFRDVNPSEISRFPHAVLEIKLKEDVNGNRRRPAWVEDLMGSHLVHAVPRFSKFAHGVASLFDDYVNTLPFWLSDLEADIRKDPQTAFLAEEQRKAERAEDELVVGSFLGNKVGSFIPSRSSPKGRSYLAERAARDPAGGGGGGASTSATSASVSTAAVAAAAAATAGAANGNGSGRRGGVTSPDGDGGGGGEDADNTAEGGRRNYGTLSSVLPGFSLSKWARAKREAEAAAVAESGVGPLPEGVVEPKEWIKNAGPLRIEPKVWLANERTFLKWQHICILLGTLSIALYTAASGSKHKGKHANLVAELMGLAYILIAAFAGGWGYYMLRTRRSMIVARSGRDFDNMVGPLVVSVALMVALLLNFAFAYRSALERWEGLRVAEAAFGTAANGTIQLLAGGTEDELR